MKNLLLFLFLSTSIAFAQVEKPTEGEMFQVTFMPNLDGTAQFGLDNAQMVYRKFTDATSVTRWKSSVGFKSVQGNDDDEYSASLMYGREKHHEGSARLATYKGWEAGAAYSSLGEDFALTAAYFIGANYYFAQNIYLGLELNYTAYLGDQVVSISPGVNGMFTLGFKL